MATTLILMRHGKAKAIVEGQSDFDRELTEAGKRSLAASLEGSLSLVDKSACPLQVWASPSARTMQTAELLLDALRSSEVKVKDPIQEIDALWNQDEEEFLDLVRDCECETVVAVGHNPMMESLVFDLTGARIPLATGGLVAMRLNWSTYQGLAQEGLTENETSQRILWFTQGPISQHWRTLVQMEKTIRNASDKIENRLKAFLDDPNDIENMHKFRVSIRTMRSLLAFVKPWMDTKQNTQMQDDLREVVLQTSRLRELDVLAEQAQGAEPPSSRTVEFCQAEAAWERERVYAVLEGKRTRKLLKRVANQAKSISWRRRYCEDGLPSSAVRKHFEEMAASLEQDLSTLDLAGVEATHDVRKTAKRVRYVAENFSDLIGDDAIDIANGMTSHQDNLGSICDARVNIDLINGLAQRDDVPEPVTWDLALLRAQNETYLYTTLREQMTQG